MGAFVLSLIGVAIINGVVGMISPEGDVKKYVRFVGALCVLLTIVTPVYGAISDGGLSVDGLFPDIGEEGSDYESIYQESLLNGGRELANSAMKGVICRELDIPEESFEVDIRMVEEDGAYIAQSARVILYDSAIFADPRDISALVNERISCECTVVYGER